MSPRPVNRRPPKPGPSRDWRALAADRPLPEHAHDAGPDDVRVTLRTRADGTRVVLLVGTVALERPGDVRAVARRLDAAADALEKHPV